MNAVRINGSGGNSLEIDVVSGDFMVTLKTFDTSCGEQRVTAQFPNPNNGGGDRQAYVQMREIYDLLQKYQKSPKT